jgi:DNA-binding NarL/FixJ family response regulator
VTQLHLWARQLGGPSSVDADALAEAATALVMALTEIPQCCSLKFQRAAAAGQVVLAPEVAARVSRAVSSGRPRKGGDAFAALSDRELQLLDLLAAGADNFAIARATGVAPKTVRNQVSTLIDKLGVRDRADAMHVGREAGLGAG